MVEANIEQNKQKASKHPFLHPYNIKALSFLQSNSYFQTYFCQSIFQEQTQHIKI